MNMLPVYDPQQHQASIHFITHIAGKHRFVMARKESVSNRPFVVIDVQRQEVVDDYATEGAAAWFAHHYNRKVEYYTHVLVDRTREVQL
jgi:hypothetical protein